MVPACSTDDKEISITFKVRDVNKSGENSVQHVAIGLREKVQELFKTVGELYNYEPTSFELILQNLKTGGTYILNEYKYHPLTDLGHFLNFDLPNNVTLTPRKKRRGAATAKTTTTATRSRDFYTAGVTVDSLRAPPPPPVATGGGGGVVIKAKVTTTADSAAESAVWSGSSSSSCNNTVESEEERYKSTSTSMSMSTSMSTSTSMSMSTATTTGSMKLMIRPVGGGGGESSSGNNEGGGGGQSGNNVEDDLSLGASASPTTGGQDTEEEEEEDGRGDVGVAGGGGGGGEVNGREKRRVYDDRGDINTFKERNSRFLGGHVKFFEFDDPTTSLTEEEDTKHHVGLVNQAMTCYLNSLLQALFNTPEFRNALYNWEFDGSSPDNSIPFQLQKLFVNLQTSPRTAVETTDLTHSFGWGMQAAWEQHDIQELCRVMFDALEQKFKDTRQANLINDLYEGKMLDYVRCVECGTDKSREDTFLDIPLPVRPFGSTVAYTSVEEALRAFVQPETLDGANQYHCDSCNKKCDAHKGLKFIKLPYLLTLHLKRFDFDYSTMHRVKLNDKVVFPEKLNLNSFVTNTSIPSTLPDEILEDRESGSVKCDDCSTTDYGSALDDESCQGTDASSFINCPFENYQDDDEGIDVSSGNNLNENEKNRRQEPQGPYFYELFSIMIHSGSASGGHYYAYIKDFENHNWYCYNDTNVARITEEDVQKTYGGGPQRGYYSGAYTSSTNAYMLMYRQINADRNASAMTVEQFPPHITSLLNHIRNAEESKRLAKEQENYMRQMKVYCYHPVKDQLVSMKHFVVSSDPLSVITEQTRAKLELENVVALEDCRLVHYNRAQDWIETSFENPGEIKFESVARESKESWLFEIKQPGTEWTIYDHSTVNLRTYLLNLDTFDIDSQLVIRVPYNCCLAVLRKHVLPALSTANVGQRFINPPNGQQLHFVLKSADESFQYLLDDIVYFTAGRSVNKLFLAITAGGCKEGSVEWFEGSKLRELVQRCECLVEFNVVFPDTDINILNALTIPSLDLNQNFDRIMDMSAVDNNRPVSPNLRVSPQPGGSNSGAVPPSLLGDGFGDHSNSEDSSLSDSDRTLVGDAPDLHLSSPVDPPDIFNKTHQEVNMNMNWDEPTMDNGCKNHSYYFKAHRIDSTASQQPISTVSTPQTSSLHTLRVLADQRMLLSAFKENLSPHIGVPVDYFKLYRLTGNKEIEWSFRLELIDGSTSTSGGNTVTSTEACDSILVKLERNLRDCEYAVTIYEFKPRPTEGEEVYRILFDWIIGAGQLVSTVKKDILQHAQKHHMLDIPYNRARLRKKNNKNPSTIYLDDQTFVEQISIRGSAEIFLETLTQDETMQGNQFSFYLRHWQPSTLTLSPPMEFTVEKPTTLLSLQQLAASFMLTTSSNLLPAKSSTNSSEESTISSSEEVPIEEVEVAVVRTAYPGDGVSLLQMNLAWNGTELTHNQARLDERYEDGTVFFCRDRREPIKELSASEREEFLTKENLRLDNVGSSANTNQSSFSNDNNTTTYTRRRERALKIYLDTSPSKEPESMAID